MSVELPTLYSLTSKDAVVQWTVSVFRDADYRSILRKASGALNGAIVNRDKIIIGKNIGKKNETSPYDQANKDMESAWKKKIDKNYTEHIPSPGDKPAIVLPMLAHDYRKRAHDIHYPAYVQPKLNGVRCLATKMSDSQITFRSRKGKSYDDALVHLKEPLLNIMKIGDIFDGEIYNHDMSFQEIIRRVKKLREDSDHLQFWVYDMGVSNTSYAKRHDELLKRISGVSFPMSVEMKSIYDDDGFPIKRLTTVLAMNEDRMKIHQKEFVAEGFEGIIIRNLTGEYSFGNRSKDLQKLKDFMDKEFKIIGGKPGAGTEEGCVVFHLEIEPGKTFWCRPRGTQEHKRQMMRDIDKLKGKYLTVRFFEYSEDEIPTGNTVGYDIRDYE